MTSKFYLLSLLRIDFIIYYITTRSNLVNMDILYRYKLLDLDFQVRQSDKPQSNRIIIQINVQNLRISSHYPICMITKSFPVHVTCGRIFLVLFFQPDINTLFCVICNWRELHDFHLRKALSNYVGCIYQLCFTLLHIWNNV